jgi:hypothetical protein
VVRPPRCGLALRTPRFRPQSHAQAASEYLRDYEPVHIVEEFEELDGYRNAMRVSFLLDIEVVNRSAEEIVVRTLALKVRYPWSWRRRRPSVKVSAISLPSRVRQDMGSGVRLMTNWFSRFKDGHDYLTVDGIIALTTR